VNKKTINLEAVSFWHSWAGCAEDFGKILPKLQAGSVSESDKCKLINVSSGKYVYRCQDGGFDFACKIQNGKKFWRYIGRPSLPLREVLHYRWREANSFPVPRVLAAGEIRHFGRLQKSFLVTDFLDNTLDGRIFMPGGKMRNGFEELRHVYCQQHLTLLAKLHDLGGYHKAFHPRNLLFRGDTAADLELFWIDVARLRRATNLRRAAIVDLHTFFRDMLLPEAETRDLTGVYLAAVQKKIFASNDELISELINFKRRMFSRKKYRIFE